MPPGTHQGKGKRPSFSYEKEHLRGANDEVKCARDNYQLRERKGEWKLFWSY